MKYCHVTVRRANNNNKRQHQIVEQLELSVTVRMQQWYSYSGKQFGYFYKIKHTLNTWWLIPFLGIYPKEIKTYVHRETCMQIFIVTLFKISPNWKQPKCPSTDEWTNQM